MKTFGHYLEENKKIAIPKAIANEFRALEVDTLDDHSPKEKALFVNAFEDGEHMKSGAVKLSLGNTELEYMKKSLKNMHDVAKDNMNKRLMSSIEKFSSKL